MIAPLERLASNPLVQPSQISFTHATGTFNPGATIDHASGKVVLLVRVFEEETRRSCIAIALSSDGERIDEIWDRPAIGREESYEEWGVEDARVTWLGEERRYAITYTGYSPAGPRVCLITTDDLLAPERYRRHGPRIAGENKNCVVFPEKVDGQYVILHRPMPRIVCIRVPSLESSWPETGVPLVGPRCILSASSWRVGNLSWFRADRDSSSRLHESAQCELHEFHATSTRTGNTTQSRLYATLPDGPHCI